jgi:hypothetical protein
LRRVRLLEAGMVVDSSLRLESTGAMPWLPNVPS